MWCTYMHVGKTFIQIKKILNETVVPISHLGKNRAHSGSHIQFWECSHVAEPGVGERTGLLKLVAMGSGCTAAT